MQNNRLFFIKTVCCSFLIMILSSCGRRKATIQEPIKDDTSHTETAQERNARPSVTIIDTKRADAAPVAPKIAKSKIEAPQPEQSSDVSSMSGVARPFSYPSINSPEVSQSLYEAQSGVSDPEVQSSEKSSANGTKKNDDKKADTLVEFAFDNEDLTSVVNKFAGLRGINIVFPQGGLAITQKITFKLKRKISVEQAERFLDTFLELAGYAKVPHGSFYMIVKNDVNSSREALPLYVGTPPSDLPNTEERIRAVYYLQNLKVPENTEGTEPLTLLLNDMLSAGRKFNYDTKSNAIIVADKSNNIRAVMAMILELDSTGTQDSIYSMGLFNTSAVQVANMLKTYFLPSGDQAGGKVAKDLSLYFAPGTKVVADPRTNSLIMLGKEPAITRLSEFIRDKIDVAVETGTSVMHVYELQYLDAVEFAPILQNVVNSQSDGGSGQATKDASAGGPYRTFESVVVRAEILSESQKIESKAGTSGPESILKGTVYRGGNRILVSALQRDWDRIKKLVQELDRPQLQVIVQVMVVDFDANNSKLLGTQTRNPSELHLPAGMNFQTTHLAGFTILPQPPKTLATDLLMLLSGGANPESEAKALTSTTDGNGSTIISFNDPNGSGIWSFLQWLSTFGETKVLSHPHFVVVNNHKAEQVISTIKRSESTGRTGEGGTIASKLEDIVAALKVSVVPRASSIDRVNLQISVIIDQFEGTQFNRANRAVHTNVNMGSGQMLVLGGLSSTSHSEADSQTPLLGRIPIIRWFFSESNKSVRKTNLAVFLIPTVVEPKVRGGINRYTHDTIGVSYKEQDEGSLFSNLKDPITYFFFDDGSNIVINEIDQYLSASKGEFVYKKAGRKECPVPVSNVMTADAQKVKSMLATQKNPLINGSSQR